MGIEFDPSPQLQQYAHPNKLVTNAWLGAKLGTPGLKVVEVDADSLLYDIGHIPTAVRVKWYENLSDPVWRDLICSKEFEELMDRLGITREDTVVFYGDHANLWAVYALWVFELFGHPDVRILDGGRDAWMQEEREISYAVDDIPQQPGYSVASRRNDHTHRIFVDELRTKFEGCQIIDLRDAEEYTGEVTLPGYPIRRNGHVPGAVNHRADSSLLANSRFCSAEAIEANHSGLGLDPTRPTVVYCNNGARAALEWFVLRFLLGWEDVRVYDGSWIEWGNMMRVPIERG
ncbi:sulfurtransferase [Corynebacterium macclintockiae]|uniref:sulfurtransferase n=1 Tax=Corynebacterium macclintockiae TaxID=2913501 RepID=UPI003EB8D2E5